MGGSQDVIFAKIYALEYSVPYNNSAEAKPIGWIKNLNFDSLDWDDKEWKEKLKGSTLKRVKPWMWKRNINAVLNNN